MKYQDYYDKLSHILSRPIKQNMMQGKVQGIDSIIVYGVNEAKLMRPLEQRINLVQDCLSIIDDFETMYLIQRNNKTY